MRLCTGLHQSCMTAFVVFTSLHMSAHICSNEHTRLQKSTIVNLQFTLEDYSQGEGAIVPFTHHTVWYHIIINLNELNT